jgi:hypothetical protein
MGTGVGEAMLLGAAMGGGSAAITGGDPLKGALLGGLTGGAGAGIAPALGAVAPEAATTLAGSALTATPTAAQVGTQLGVQGAATGIGSQSAMLAEQMAGFGPQGIASLQGAAQAAIPAGTLPSTAVTAVGAPVAQTAIPSTGGTFGEGMAKFAGNPMASLKANPFTAAGAGLAGAIGGREEMESPGEYDGPLKRFRFNPETYRPAMYAEGGIANLAGGGYDRMVGEQPMYMSNMARGGISDLGGYSDYARGGRMLKGPGDGMSDSIPASIAGKRPARLANEEFVVPADVVSHLGNGSSDAGAKQLYAMMDRVRTARTGRKSQGREIRPQKYMAA